MTVLGGQGAWPTAGQACSGYLIEYDGFRLFIDPGYATLPRLLRHIDAADVDAVLVSHGHPDHCADLNPLLRSRALANVPAPALPVYALPAALDPVLALDRPGMLAAAYRAHDIEPGKRFTVGPFTVDTLDLPHFVPNVGMRIAAGGALIAYTGDCGDSPDLLSLAADADVFLAEATYVDEVPDARFLSSAALAGSYAAAAGAGRLVLTHAWPGTDPAALTAAATAVFAGPVLAAVPDLVIDVAGR